MKDVGIVIFNDKSWVRFTEYQKLQEENERLAKRICELQSDLAKTKSLTKKGCFNCIHDDKNDNSICDPCIYGLKNNWELAE